MSVRDDVLAFLRDLPGFARGAQDPNIWLPTLMACATPKLPLGAGLRPSAPD